MSKEEKMDLPTTQDAAVDILLNRPPPLDYMQEWEAALGREKTENAAIPHGAIVIFRLGSEYLALSSMVIGQITTLRTVHRIPHSKNPVMQGVVNVNGRLRLFVSLEAMLEIGGKGRLGEKPEATPGSTADTPMILFEYEGEVWTFAVTEVLGVFHCDLTNLKNVPVTVMKSSANYVKGVLNWKDRPVGLLDEGLLAFSLRRSL